MMRQSSLFPMRTDGHFFLAEPLSQCLLMALSRRSRRKIGHRSKVRTCQVFAQLRHERLIFAATRDAVLAGRLC